MGNIMENIISNWLDENADFIDNGIGFQKGDKKCVKKSILERSCNPLNFPSKLYLVIIT